MASYIKVFLLRSVLELLKMSLITYFSFVIILSSAIADDDFTVDPNWRPITSVEGKFLDFEKKSQSI